MGQWLGFARQLTIALGLAVTLAPLFGVRPSNAGQSTNDVFQIVAHDYVTGDLKTATKTLQEFAESNASTADKIEARIFLGDICNEFLDFQCMVNNNVALVALENGLQDQKLQTKYWPQVSALVLRQITLLQQFKSTDVPKQFDVMNHWYYGLFASSQYMMLQSSEALYAALYGNLENARRAISRLNERAAALNDDDVYLPRYLVEIIQDFLTMSDGFHALIYASAFDKFILSNLPEYNATTIRYLELSAELEADVGTPPLLAEGLQRLDKATDLLQHLKAPDQLVANEIARVALQKTELYYLGGHLQEALDQHANNPLQARRSQIQQQGRFGSDTEFNFALVDIFLARASGKPIDDHWLPLLKAPLFWETGHKSDEQFEVARHFGLALVQANTDPAQALGFLKSAALADVALFEGSLFARTNAFPIPNFFDRIVLGSYLDKLSENSALSQDERNFVVKSIDILQRNILHSRGDILYRLADLESDKERRIAHSWVLLSTRRDEVELRSVKARTDAFVTYRKSKVKTPQADTGTRFRIQLDELNDRIDDLANGWHNRHVELPTINEISSLMTSDEAVVSEATYSGKLFKVCVGPNNGFVLVRTPIPEEIEADIKVLRAALTADYPPSLDLDAQYPVGAAVRLSRLILGGLDECLGGKKRIDYSLAGGGGIPLQALLQNAPPKQGNGYDLSVAPWLVRKYEFVGVSSVEEFVAARRLSKFAGGEFSFLGVGDPVLAQPLDQGITGGEALAMRGAPSIGGKLTSLRELPETGVELRRVATEFYKPRLLLRGDASKAEFKSEPLGHFNVMEFATHGLVTGDLSGINEPGLVLTPTPSKGGTASDDGFLSSTEISALMLKAKLVVLSACNTANFAVDQFAGSIRGLTESFAMSGVPTVVASLWPVDSKTSETIIASFFASMKRGASASGAFATAQRNFLNSPPSKAYLHPRFWGPFVVLGDGNEVIDDSTRTRSDQLVNFVVGDERGEIGGLTRPPASTAVYDTRSSGTGEGRFSSVIESRSETGAINWRVADNSIGAGDVASDKNRLFVTGFLSNPGGTVWKPVLRSFDLDGHLLWRKDLDYGQLQSSFSDLSVSESNILWTLVDSHPSDQSVDNETLHVIALTEDGTLKNDWEIVLKHRPNLLAAPKMALYKGDAYIFVSKPGTDGPMNFNDFGDLEPCEIGETTEVYQIQNGSTAPIYLGSAGGIRVTRVKQIDNHVYVMGTKLNSCGSGAEALLGELSLQGRTSGARSVVQELYVERGLTGGQFTDLVGRQGRFVLSGTIDMRATEMDVGPVQTSGIPMMLNGYSYQRVDSFLESYNPTDRKGDARIHFVDTGANTFILNMDEHGEALTLTGSVGFRPLWAQYSLH